MKNKYSFSKKIVLLLLAFLFLRWQSVADWEKVTNLPDYYKNVYWLEIEFLATNTQYGWLCGYGGSILRTTDGGKTWQGSSLPLDLQLESIHFVDTKTGYTSGIDEATGDGYIFKSTNGGASWFDVSPNTDGHLWGNYFITASVGVVVGEGCVGTQHYYRTTNGGNSWSLFEGNVVESGMTDVILYSDNTGYATSSGVIWYSSNGGITWSPVATSGDKDWQEELSIKGNSMLVPYCGGCGGGFMRGGARFSMNKGKTWKDFSSGQPMFGAFLNDSAKGWCAGWSRSVYRTSNGGTTWEIDNCGILDGDDLDDIFFLNDTLGWVVGTSIYKYKPRDIGVAAVVAEGDTTFCQGDSIVLRASTDRKYFAWSNGAKDTSVVVKQPGKYYITAWSNECDSVVSNKINVSLYPFEKPIITAKPLAVCQGDTAILSVEQNYEKYYWNTTDTSKSIKVNSPGIYSVSVINSYGCSGTTNFDFVVHPNPEVKTSVVGDSAFCVGDTSYILANKGFVKYYWYNTEGNQLLAESSYKLLVSTPGTYYVVVVDSNGCQGVSATTSIIVYPDSNKLKIQSISPEETVFRIDSTNFTRINCRNLLVKNTSYQPVTITSPVLYRNIEFSLSLSSYPITIQSGDSAEITICYSPTALGEQRDTLLLDDYCFPHIIPLVSDGVPNVYSQDAGCGVTLWLTSYSLAGYLLDYSLPVPNPATKSVSMPYIKQEKTDGLFEGTCMMFNSMGIKVLEGKEIIESKKSSNDKTITRGKFEFDTEDLPNGTYFIVLSSPFGEVSRPVIILK